MMNSDISNSPERCSGHHHSSQQQQQQQQQRSSLLLSPPYNIAAAAAPTTTTTTTTTPITSSYHNTPLLPIKVTCLVKANDTSEENVLYSDRLGLRFRHILTDASQTVASFSKSIVEEHEFVKYVQAVCQDFAKGCNCDVMLCYGDDKKTRVIMRYLDHETSSQHGSCPGVGGGGGVVVRDEIMMFVRLVEKSDAATLSTTVLRAKDSIYKHISLSSCSQVQEVYIAPSSCTLYDISNRNSTSKSGDDESVLLISVKNNQVQCPVEMNPSRERIQEFISSCRAEQQQEEDVLISSSTAASGVDELGGAVAADLGQMTKTTTNTSTIHDKKRNHEWQQKQQDHEDEDDLTLPKFRRKRRKRLGQQHQHQQQQHISVEQNDHSSNESKRTSSLTHENDTRSMGMPNLVGEKVMKHFEGYGDYCGEVVEFDSHSGWYTVQYEDNDVEQLSFDDVIKYATFYRSSELVPGTVDMSGSFYSSLSDDTPGKIANKVGCDIKTLLELNSMRLTKSKRGLKASSKVWEKTIFFLPDTCDMNKLELLWGKRTVESYKALYS